MNGAGNENSGEGVGSSAEKTPAPVSTRRDVLAKALRAAPVVLLLTARGAQAQGSAASGAPSAG